MTLKSLIYPSIYFSYVLPPCQVFEEAKAGVCGLRASDLPYALRCLGIDLTDHQVHALLPGIYRKSTQPDR